MEKKTMIARAIMEKNGVETPQPEPEPSCEEAKKNMVTRATKKKKTIIPAGIMENGSEPAPNPPKAAPEPPAAPTPEPEPIPYKPLPERVTREIRQAPVEDQDRIRKEAEEKDLTSACGGLKTPKFPLGMGNSSR